MKKQYIQPSMKAYTVKTESLLDNMSYGGSNEGRGINTAEGKSNYDDDWD